MRIVSESFDNIKRIVGIKNSNTEILGHLGLIWKGIRVGGELWAQERAQNGRVCGARGIVRKGKSAEEKNGEKSSNH